MLQRLDKKSMWLGEWDVWRDDSRRGEGFPEISG